MNCDLKKRHLLSLVHHSPDEIRYLLDLAKDFKFQKRSGICHATLQGKNIALIFEKTSTRTRCAFEVAAYDLGANVSYIDSATSQIGHKESIKDTARVLGRMYDAIEYRGFQQKVVEELAAYAGVPVFNGLTDEFHPTQALADVLTMIEHSYKPIEQIKYVYIGDGRNNIANSLLLIGAKLGMDVRICAPKSLLPAAELVDLCQQFALQSGARIMITDDIDSAVKDVDFVHTDVWVSMGEPLETWAQRIELLMPYQVNEMLLQRTGNSAVKFMHCLPAFHNSETQIGQQIAKQYPLLRNGIEVTESVFESPQNIAFDQAENRLHTIKAVLYASLN